MSVALDPRIPIITGQPAPKTEPKAPSRDPRIDYWASTVAQPATTAAHKPVVVRLNVGDPPTSVRARQVGPQHSASGAYFPLTTGVVQNYVRTVDRMPMTNFFDGMHAGLTTGLGLPATAVAMVPAMAVDSVAGLTTMGAMLVSGAAKKVIGLLPAS